MARRLADLIDDREAAATVGHAYLFEHPGERQTETLLALLGDGNSQDLRGKDLATWLRRRQIDDFAAGHTVELNGWILSETEARLCALAALL